MEAQVGNYRMREMHLKSINFRDRMFSEESIHVQKNWMDFHLERYASRIHRIEISGSHGSEYEDSLLRYSAV
jgi:hypothetical protein